MVLMAIEVDPEQVLQVWRTGSEQVLDDLGAASRGLKAVEDTDLGDLSVLIHDVLVDLHGVGTSAERLVDELGDNVKACMQTYVATEQASAGTFDELRTAV
jgi:hypothetical protein